jgi:hypothetical protein
MRAVSGEARWRIRRRRRKTNFRDAQLAVPADKLDSKEIVGQFGAVPQDEIDEASRP